ncbi:uncharacterized protein EI90DRAFT_2534043 [Cantharellus anzutake]|uniref:uncharacterized protein n=1 Tax=Cantharellus anzutake TaxID=1750568 RepID=UPI0019041F49|nr:uncharacterized protein EI90DRAFT_2534043 [Cantharellus anzutake]KAF8338037.1 hypothetical protein EI90DRAFT_2534043 [Cantharellus anzutake]
MHLVFSLSFYLYLGAGASPYPATFDEGLSEKIGLISLLNTTTQKHDELRTPIHSSLPAGLPTALTLICSPIHSPYISWFATPGTRDLNASLVGIHADSFQLTSKMVPRVVTVMKISSHCKHRFM